MPSQMNGMIILNAIPNDSVEHKVWEFLSCHAKKIPADKLKDLIQKTPVVLSKNVSEKVGKTIVSKLEMLGASATFVSKSNLSKTVTQTQQTTIEQESHLTSAQENSYTEYTNSELQGQFKKGFKNEFFAQLMETNKELWLILSMIAIKKRW